MGLDTVELLIAVEEEFDIKISNEEAYHIRTVGELAKLTAKHISIKTGEPIDYQQPLEFIISHLVEQENIPRRTISTVSRFVEDLGLD